MESGLIAFHGFLLHFGNPFLELPHGPSAQHRLAAPDFQPIPIYLSTGPFPTYRYRFVSPEAKPIGSSESQAARAAGSYQRWWWFWMPNDSSLRRSQYTRTRGPPRCWPHWSAARTSRTSAGSSPWSFTLPCARCPEPCPSRRLPARARCRSSPDWSPARRPAPGPPGRPR